MAALSQFISHFYTVTIIFFTLLFLEIVILFRSITRTFQPSNKGPMTVDQYLKLVERTNPASLYKSRSKEQARECSVCLSFFEEDDEIRKLKQCNHTFHKHCLDTWLRQDHATCPLCRSSVLPEDVVAKHRWGRSNQEYYGSDEEMMVLLSALHGNFLRRLAY